MIFFPTSNDDVSQFLRSRRKIPLHISGNGTDRNDDEIISLAKMNAVLFYEPEEMIIAVQGGITLDELENTLAAKGQWIPTLVASESVESTLGAAIAMDHFHPRSKNAGALRTTILGGTFSTTSGEIFKSGSRVVKSVAGYDIHRAFCGSHGRFGIILDVILKVQPHPEMFFRFLAPLDSHEILLRFYPMCLGEYSGRLLVEFAGYREDILHDIEALHSLGIPFEELDQNSWSDLILKLNAHRDEEKNKTQSSEVEKLLSQTRRIFDQEGMLI